MNSALKSAGLQQDILERLDLGDLSLGPSRRNAHNRNRQRNTLAQKMGLQPQKPKELGPYEWDQIERKLLQKKSFIEHCTICLNNHGSKRTKTVMTSCGHVFHQSCLNATRSIGTAEPKCPLCRSPYFVKITKKGHLSARNYHASKIQALIRSFLTRRRLVASGRLKMPRLMRALRGDFISRSISQFSRSAINSSKNSIRDSDHLIQQSELALAAARNIFSKMSAGDQTDKNIPEIFRKAHERSKVCNECPVCLMQLEGKPLALLSCSHVMHDVCRIQLEQFLPQSEPGHCPVCRQIYSVYTV